MKQINEQRIYANYKRNAKFLGIIDYKSLIVVVIYIVLIMSILRILPFNMEILIYLFLIFVIPVIAVFCINMNNESTVDVLLIILKFFLNKRYFVRMDYAKDYKPSYFKKNDNIKPNA